MGRLPIVLLLTALLMAAVWFYLQRSKDIEETPEPPVPLTWNNTLKIEKGIMT